MRKYLSQRLGRKSYYRHRVGQLVCAECTAEICGHALNHTAVLKCRWVVGQLGLGLCSQAGWREPQRSCGKRVWESDEDDGHGTSLLGKSGSAGRSASESENVAPMASMRQELLQQGH